MSEEPFPGSAADFYETIQKMKEEISGLRTTFVYTEIEKLRAEIELFKSLIPQAFKAGWDSRSQIIRLGVVRGQEDVFAAWMAQQGEAIE